MDGAVLIVRFGRADAVGRTQQKTLSDAAAATAALEKLVAEKKKKGYSVASVPRGGSAEKAVSKKEVSSAAPARKVARAKAVEPKMAVAKKALAPATADPALAKVLAELTLVAAAKPRPASTTELAALGRALGASPPALTALYAIAGNVCGVVGAADGLLEWLDLREALVAKKQLARYGVPAGFFPLATDNAGNYALFEVATGRVRDWDHETREATALAPTLAAYLAKSVLPIRRRDVKEKAALAKEKGRPAAVGSAMPAAPKKLALQSNTLLAKLDRPSYGGGGNTLAFVGDDVVAIGFQNTCALVHLAAQSQTDVWVGADALAHDPARARLVLARWGVLAMTDATSGELTAHLQAPILHAASLALSPDGAIAAIASNQGSLDLWDVGGGKGLPKGLAPERTPSYSLPKGKPLASLTAVANFARLRFSPDGAHLAAGDDAGSVWIWHVASRKAVASVKLPAAVVGLDFAPDGTLFVGLASRKVLVFDGGGRELRSFRAPEALADLRVLSAEVVALLGPKQLAVCDAVKGRVLAKVATKKATGRHSPLIADVRGDRLLLRGPAAIVRVV